MSYRAAQPESPQTGNPQTGSSQIPDRRVVVTGFGVVSPLGDSPRELHGRLCAGACALAPIELFDVQDLPVTLGAEIPGFSARDYLGEGNLRPLDRTARLAASATERALADAGLSTEDRHRLSVGLILGTVFGSVGTISAFDRRGLEAGPRYVKPLDFANSVINAAAGQTAIWHGLPGVNSTICSGTSSGLQALAYGADLIRGGRADILVAGGAEELCFESFLGYQRTGRIAGSRNAAPPCAVPFGAGRNGFLLGEGAAFLVLEAEESARDRGVAIRAVLAGSSSGFDPSRGHDGDSAAASLKRCISMALHQAGRESSALGAVSCSANGSPTGDLYEAQGLAQALGDAAGTVPITASKGLLGESLGAGGALQAIILLESLRRGQLPGIGGSESPEAGLPLGRLEPTPRDVIAAVGLATSSSFDGHSCAIVFDGEGGTNE